MTVATGFADFAERRLELAGGGSLRYFAGGAGSPVLLVHGLGGSALNWIALAPALAADKRVLVPDLPGHGRSTALPGPTELTSFADVLEQLVEHERAAPVLVVGHSLGGLVAVRLALHRPDAVAGILLAAAAGISSTRRTARFTLEILAVVRPGRRLAPHRARIAASRPLRRVVFGWWGASDPAELPPAAAEGFLAGWEEHTDTRSAARAMLADDARADLEHVRCPCLVLWGAGDNQVGVADGFDYARRLRAPLRVIPDCGHLLIGERPDAVLDAVEALVGRLGG